MAFIVRLAEPRDEEAVRRVGEEAFAELRSVYRPSATALANLATITPALKRLVVEEGAQVIGTTRFGIFDKSVRIIGLAVLPNWQRRGAARSILRVLEDIARQKNCSTLSLYTVKATGNLCIYERLGFRIVSECEDEYSISPSGQPLVEVYMERIVE